MQDLDNKATNDSLTASEWNSTRTEVQNIILNAGLTLSAGDLNQLGKAIADLVGNNDFYTDSGTANAHVLSAVSSNQSPTTLKDGMRIRYRPANTNTGAVTVAVAGQPAKNLYYNGAAATSGLYPSGKKIEAAYSTANGRFDVVVLEDNTRFKVNGYSLNNAQYETAFSVATQETGPNGVFFKSDGLAMYIAGTTNNTVYQYTLSTAWDVSTASYASKSFNVSTQSTFTVDLSFKSDGTVMYVLDATTNTVYQYSLSTAWDVSTASYASKSFSFATQETAVSGLFLKPDGTKMYVVGTVNDTVYQYSLSTAWDVSTGSYDTVSLSVSAEDATPQGIFFSDDGTRLFMIGSTNDKVHQYLLPTSFVLTSGVYERVSLDTFPYDTTPSGLFFNPSGEKLYTVAVANDKVYQFVSNFLSV